MDEKTDYKRLLVLSNEGISNSSSNGRTLRNFLIGWPLDKIAQFYIIDSDLDYTVCSNYYHVSDQAVLNTFIKTSVKDDKPKSSDNNLRAKVGRNAISMIARNILWNSRRWWNKEFDEWLFSFQPEIVLLQAGDSAFTFKLAEDIADLFHAKLIIYNSENWYFKRYDYFRATGLKHLAYPLFRAQFCKQLRKTVKSASVTIYNSETLQRDYDLEFHLPSRVLYTSTEMEPTDNTIENNPLVFSYLGNLGLDRHKALIEFAETLHGLFPEIFLDVYGNSPDINAINELEKCEAIHYHGIVPYDEVINIMHNSDVLVHAESSDPFFREGLKRAFSTKIADSLASGRCFVLYAPDNLTCTEYLKKERAAFVVTRKEDLTNVLEIIVKNKNERSKYIKKALQIVDVNHNPGKNASDFKRILMES